MFDQGLHYMTLEDKVVKHKHGRSIDTPYLVLGITPEKTKFWFVNDLKDYDAVEIEHCKFHSVFQGIDISGPKQIDDSLGNEEVLIPKEDIMTDARIALALEIRKGQAPQNKKAAFTGVIKHLESLIDDDEKEPYKDLKAQLNKPIADTGHVDSLTSSDNHVE